MRRIFRLFVTSCPMLFVAAFISFHLLDFYLLEKVLNYLLPHGRCYLLQLLLLSFYRHEGLNCVFPHD